MSHQAFNEGLKSSFVLPPFPAEEPTRAQLEEWIDAAGPILRQAGCGPAMRGEHPPHLIALAMSADVPEVPELTAVERRDAGPIEAAKHDQLIAKAARERQSSRQQLRAGLLEYHNKLAARLEASLRPKAALRLKGLLAAHAVAGAPDCYAGGAMWRALVALKTSVGVLEDRRDHDRAVEFLRDNPLENHCSAELFADRLVELQRHVEFMERKFSDEALGKFIIDLMPACNAAEGRALVDKLQAEHSLGNIVVVIERTTNIVRKSQTRATEGMAALAEREQSDHSALRTAAIMAAINAGDEKAALLMLSGKGGSSGGGGGSAAKKRDRDLKDKSGAGKLPDGQKCRRGTCHFAHDLLNPKGPCYRDPTWLGPYPDSVAKNPAQVARIERDRKVQAQLRNIPYVPVPIPKEAMCLVTETDGWDAIAGSHDYDGLFDEALFCMVKEEPFDPDPFEPDSGDLHSGSSGSGIDMSEFDPWTSPMDDVYAVLSPAAHQQYNSCSVIKSSMAVHDPVASARASSASYTRSRTTDLTESDAAAVQVLRTRGRDTFQALQAGSSPDSESDYQLNTASPQFTAGELHLRPGKSEMQARPTHSPETSPPLDRAAGGDRNAAGDLRAAFLRGVVTAAGACIAILLCMATAYVVVASQPLIRPTLPPSIVAAAAALRFSITQIGSAASRSVADFKLAGWPAIQWPSVIALYFALPHLLNLALLGIGRASRWLAINAAGNATVLRAVVDIGLQIARHAAGFAIVILLLSCFPTPTEQTLLAAVGGRTLHVSARTIADSGASVHAINDASLAIPGSLRLNATAVSTAAGRHVPKYVCCALLNTVATDGSLVRLRLDDALLIPDCKHNLVSLNLLAKEQKVTSHLGADDGSFLLLPDGRKVRLLDEGIYVIPDAASAMLNAVTTDDAGEPASTSAAATTWRTIHNRFNGRSYEVLRNLVSSGKPVSRTWHRALKHPPRDGCHACQHARLDRQPSRSHVPHVSEPGHISYDIFEMGTPAMPGGQKYVIGFHDTFSRLNKVYLLRSKTQAPEAMDKFYAWARSLGVDIRRFHADNAPELTGPSIKDKWASRGVRVTSCVPHTPRGNGMMERQWRTIATDARHVLHTARLPRGMWWHAMRASVHASWAIPINAAETPWSRFSKQPSSPHMHRTVGCLAYYRVVKPASKADSRARRALHLGRAEDQPGYVLLDLETRRIVVSADVRFFEDEFPGLTLQPKEGEPSQDVADNLFEHSGRIDADDEADNSPFEDITRTGLDVEADEFLTSPRPVDGRPTREPSLLSDPESATEGGSPSPQHSELADTRGEEAASEDGDQNGEDEPHISQRLSRVNRGHRVHHNVSSFSLVDSRALGVGTDHPTQILAPADTNFYLYIGSGPAREGDVGTHLANIGGWPIVNVDTRVGGYDHDLTHDEVQRRVLEVASAPRCRGVFVSIPCKTFSVLRSKPGVEHSYPLRSSKHVLGIPRADGSLPPKVVDSNIMSDFTARVMRVVHDNGGVFAAESPPSRGAGSRFPIEGREDHVSQFDHPAWAELRHATGADMVYFDQCAFHYGDPGEVARKKTALLVNPKGFHAFHKLFSPRICTHDYDAHAKQVYGLGEDGRFRSPTTENYPSEMNALIARALVHSCEEAVHETAMVLGLWDEYFNASSTPIWRDSTEHSNPISLLQSALPLVGPHFLSSSLYYTGIDEQLFAAPRDASSDNPTYRQARASPQWPQWEAACEAEIQNLKRLGTIDEDNMVPENTLPTWDPIKKSAREVLNVLWVLRVKYNDGVFEKFKARAVVDGRDQKKKNPFLETFSPACRSTTYKLLVAESCRLGYRKRTWDVEAAYLKGIFSEDSEPVMARPPPGYRTYLNGVALLWCLKTPLYGEADAGRIWYQTLVKYLLEERKFTQSRYDPCLFWKKFSDGSYMYIIVYVDDGFSIDNGSTEADSELGALNERFKITIKCATFFLGNNITCHSDARVTLSSRAYIERMVEKYLPGVATYPKFRTPSDGALMIAYDEALQARRQDEPVDASLKESYASKVGALIYVVPVCRVDCALTIGILARCLTFPSKAMDEAANRCLAYLSQHPDLGLTYDASTARATLHAYSDSNWTTSHSTSGWAILYGGAAIGYGSKRQQSIALSSTEAEIMAASIAATEILYFRGILSELGHELEPTILYVDNQGAVELSKDMKSCQRSRHIERRYLKVRELVAQGEIVVKFVESASNHADILTKPLDRDAFQRHFSALMGATDASIP